MTVEEDLRERRERLAGTIASIGEAPDLVRLLGEVDAALRSFSDGTHGMCEVCDEPVEDDVLASNPMARYCLCHVPPQRLAALQRDLDLAWRIQSGLLPRQNLSFAGWETHYRYVPAGPVSGDYCDLVAHQGDGDALYFLLGDVSGKGVAASFLMAHLNALFRSLIGVGLPLAELVESANRVFSKSTLANHYATLVAGKATANGSVEICNAGHLPPLVVRHGGVCQVSASGLPVGVFDSSPYLSHHVTLDPGDTLFLYTDGLTETVGPEEREYGIEGLSRLLRRSHDLDPTAMAAAALSDLDAHQAGTERSDDLTLMVVRRSAWMS
jgi:sigma-B regulation protein RsbU (phosphoserine phosphatase)